MNPAELFPDEEYRFRMGLRPVGLTEYFRPRDAAGALLAERAHWLGRTPERYARLEPDATALLEAFVALTGAQVQAPDGRTGMRLEELGRRLEPDFLLLAPDARGEFRLRGGVLCFPTGWALEEKIGRTVDEIHGVVPGLNRALGPALGQLLGRLRPGEAWQRSNWGLAATPELNLHPGLGRPTPKLPVALDSLWLRVEEQALAALPGTTGIVFAIRIEVARLDEVVRDPAAAGGLVRALDSMPAALAVYKRLDLIRGDLIERLRE